MKNWIKIAILGMGVSLVVILGGCTSASSVNYTDPTAVDTLSTNFSSTDLQTITSGMVNSLSTSPLIANAYKQNGGALIIYVDSIQNNTDQHIDTSMISNAITSQILNTGLFQLVDMNAMSAAKKQLDFQAYSGMVDQAKAIQLGTMTGAQYMMYGNVGNITQQNTSQQSVFYQITLSLLDLKSGFIVWQNTQQIRKIATKKAIGW
ncbi:MAG: penicillin-binding protein activator LpoB [Fusobacteria bacterium]|nr:penicillin-binding protein activator LpoB [Fusobacteriota bacterium]